MESEVGRFLEKVSRWREESEKELSNIIQFHSSSINSRIQDLVEEVSDLKVTLSVIAKERDDLLDTVHTLSNGIKQRSDALSSPQASSESREIQSNDTPRTISPSSEAEHDVEIFTISSEIGDQDYIAFNESQDLNNDEERRDKEMTNDKDNEEYRRENDTTKGNKRKEIPTDLTDNSQQYESKCSKNIVPHDDHVCPECNFAFSTSENLEIHLKNVHPKLELINDRESIKKRKNKKFMCPHCLCTSAKLRNIKQHIISVHEKIKKHVCEECGYAALQKGDLKKHIEVVHMNLKSYVCEECGYTSRYLNALKVHVKIVHENTKNHICRECGYAASTRHIMKRHIEAVH